MGSSCKKKKKKKDLVIIMRMKQSARITLVTHHNRDIREGKADCIRISRIGYVFLLGQLNVCVCVSQCQQSTRNDRDAP